MHRPCRVHVSARAIKSEKVGMINCTSIRQCPTRKHMILEIRSGAPARPAPEAEDADPTHGSYDFQAFLQSEIGGLRGTSRLVHKTSACPRINYNFPGFAEMLISFVSQRFEGFWETMCGPGNHVRWTMTTVGMAPAQTQKHWFYQGFPMISHWNSHLPRGRPQPTAKEP